MLLDALDPNSPAFTIMRHWVPPLISIMVGGLFASILFPRWQAAYVKSKSATEHRLNLLEDLAVAFAKYITSWRRLIQIARFAETRELSETEAERRDGFVLARNDARDALMELCARGQLYFSDTACAEIRAFVEWDEAQTAKTLEDLPSIAEWREWETRIIERLRRDEQADGHWRR